MKNYLPRFTLRDLFWLVLVVAVATGWWRDQKVKTEKHDQELGEIATRAAIANTKEAHARMDLKTSETLLRLRLTELAKLHFALRQLDRATQVNVKKLAHVAPEPKVFEPRDVSDPTTLIAD